MMPDRERPVRDMMLRTMKNLAFIEQHANADEKQTDVFEVTQLVNSFLAALAHPWEIHREALDQMGIQTAVNDGWPRLPVECDARYTPKNLGDLLRRVRNALAHGHIRFRGNNEDDITDVEMWDVNWNNKRTWGTTVSVDSMRTFLVKFVQLAEMFPEPEHIA